MSGHHKPPDLTAERVAAVLERDPTSSSGPSPTDITKERSSRSEQVDTVLVSDESVVRSKEFNAGVADVRRGRAPRFDDPIGRDWNYERGRQWALLAPMRMPPKIDGKANPEAVKLLRLASRKGWIL